MRRVLSEVIGFTTVREEEPLTAKRWIIVNRFLLDYLFSPRVMNVGSGGENNSEGNASTTNISVHTGGR